ncbi:metalloregulator ArsR/SmtB family transcription factor [Marinobacter halodurans]|uniref:Metalloregulator ArsR/SmtB family transcription factor n=1 Tax=Marinobacter halodurans TaxID=2528979 RepID=A0ABY1ZGB2_9GAMM|nr:metalloregulator ArsR/SmtB family transcription factor [Marinobacter halodurans]TBW50766.1 metalloregulator ArsR/SmtB family transcription factor [Marinobacter halodurans]
MNSIAPFPADQPAALDVLAPVLKASGDPLRLEILRVLQRDTFGVLELSRIFDMRQSGMSHHLKVLSQAGLLEPQREGNAIFYRRPLRANVESLADRAVHQVFELVDQVVLPAHLSERIQEIRDQRADQSQAFFARHAEQFREQQELIAAFEQYAEPVAELIAQKAAGQRWRASLEIGPGEGAFLAELGRISEQVVAVDNSRDMLSKARISCEDTGLDNIRLLEGTADRLRDEHRASFDLVVANMVLHHVPSPADIFVDAAALMRDGGYLVISDLCSHDQNWAKANCGDLWLGFEPEELSAWARDAGLETGETLFIGLRNGFQIQVREFRKPESQ